MIVTLTLNPAIDKSSNVDLVEPEHKLRCDRPIYEPGGGGLNIARAVRNLKGRAHAVWTCGGFSGERLNNLLDGEENFSHQPVHIRAETRENLIVFETHSQRQYRFGMPGAEIQPDELDRVIEAIDRVPDMTFLVASGSLPPGVPENFLIRLGEFAKMRGVRYVVDTSGSALRHVLDEASLFLIKPNLRELCAIARCEVESDQGIRDAAESLIDDGRVEAVLVSLGAGGARLVHRKGTLHIPAPVVPIRSKVGAGDSTVAGVLLGLQRGLSLSDAARYGVAAGAAAVMTEGTGLCRADDTERLFEQIKDEVKEV